MGTIINILLSIILTIPVFLILLVLIYKATEAMPTGHVGRKVLTVAVTTLCVLAMFRGLGAPEAQFLLIPYAALGFSLILLAGLWILWRYLHKKAPRHVRYKVGSYAKTFRGFLKGLEKK